MNLALSHQVLTRVEEWLIQGRPTQNALDWNLEAWSKEFPEHKEFLEELKLEQIGYIDRDLVRNVVQRKLSEGLPQEAFLVSMIWGYGEVRYGPYRVRKIIDQKNTDQILVATISALQQGLIKEAYDTLITNGPTGLGPAFGTKFLYFAAPSNLNPMPLILDKIMADALNEWGSIGYSINSQKNDSKLYLDYCQQMADAADELEIRSDELEEVLFTAMATSNGSSTWANSSSTQHLNPSQHLVYGLLLASEIMLRDPDLMLIRTAPGGGQYDNLTLISLSGSRRHNIEINLNGSILYPDTTPIRFSWENLRQRGIQNTLGLLSIPLSISETVVDTPSPWSIGLRNLVSAAIRSQCKHAPLVVSEVMQSKMNSSWRSALNFDSPSYSHQIFPAESWFWSLADDTGISRVIDLKNGESVNESGTRRKLSWP